MVNSFHSTELEGVGIEVTTGVTSLTDSVSASVDLVEVVSSENSEVELLATANVDKVAGGVECDVLSLFATQMVTLGVDVSGLDVV